MPARKRTYEKVQEFTYSILNDGKSIPEASADIGFSKAVATLALKDAVTFKIITQEQYDKIHHDAYTKKHRELENTLNPEQLRDHYSNMGINSAISNGIEKLIEKGVKGGTATQKHYARKVARNLKKAKHYGTTGCKYEDIWFDSQGERMTGLLLKSYGLLEDIVLGVNFQKEFGRCVADFYIPEKDMVIEYHPIPQQTFNDIDVEIASSIESYVEKRQEQLKYHFQGKILAIPAPSGKWSAKEFFTRLEDMGLTEDWRGFLERCRKIRTDISIFEKQYELDMKSAEPEEEAPF